MPSGIKCVISLKLWNSFALSFGRGQGLVVVFEDQCGELARMMSATWECSDISSERAFCGPVWSTAKGVLCVFVEHVSLLVRYRSCLRCCLQRKTFVPMWL
jgi:hypothetical protein